MSQSNINRAKTSDVAAKETPKEGSHSHVLGLDGSVQTRPMMVGGWWWVTRGDRNMIWTCI